MNLVTIVFLFALSASGLASEEYEDYDIIYLILI